MRSKQVSGQGTKGLGKGKLVRNLDLPNTDARRSLGRALHSFAMSRLATFPVLVLLLQVCPPGHV